MFYPKKDISLCLNRNLIFLNLLVKKSRIGITTNLSHNQNDIIK